jgi:hypothetical protein
LPRHHRRRKQVGSRSGNGNIQLILRATTEDYQFGDMTIIDFPFGFGFTLNGYSGTVSVTKKVGDLLLSLSQPRSSDCTTLEVVSIAVRDPNGTLFAVPGVRY